MPLLYRASSRRLDKMGFVVSIWISFPALLIAIALCCCCYLLGRSHANSKAPPPNATDLVEAKNPPPV